MKIRKHTTLFPIIILLFLLFSVTGIAKITEAFYWPIPTWSQNYSYGWGGPPMYMNYNMSETYSNPYMYGPPVGYYPYNAMFNMYTGVQNVNMGYNQNVMGYYNAANYSGYNYRDVNAIGYPLPYAYTDQRSYANQMNYLSASPGYLPQTASYYSAGNPFNVYYNPAAFTVDLGLDAYVTGINNFWNKVFTDLNQEDEENTN